jgi:hypothetical protein
VLTLAKITRTRAGGYAEYLEGKARAATLGDYYLKDGKRVQAPGLAQDATQFGLEPVQPVRADSRRSDRARRTPTAIASSVSAAQTRLKTCNARGPQIRPRLCLRGAYTFARVAAGSDSSPAARSAVATAKARLRRSKSSGRCLALT